MNPSTEAATPASMVFDSRAPLTSPMFTRQARTSAFVMSAAVMPILRTPRRLGEPMLISPMRRWALAPLCHPEARDFCGPKDLCILLAAPQPQATPSILRRANNARLWMTKQVGF